MEQITDQQKLEILCAYLPYGVEVEINLRVAGDNYPEEIRRKKLTADNIGSLLSLQGKPILRHPDDMTDEELKELAGLIGYDNIKYTKWWLMGDPYDVTIQQAKQALNYLHSIHIDTFGAIEAGWAIRKNN